MRSSDISLIGAYLIHVESNCRRHDIDRSRSKFHCLTMHEGSQMSLQRDVDIDPDGTSPLVLYEPPASR